MHLSAVHANVSGNLVDFGGTLTAMLIRGVDLLVSANSVRSRDVAGALLGLRVDGSPVAPGPVRVIVTSNLTSGILATSTGALVRANNIPAP